MNLQYILDSQGEPSGVYIPIELWESLKERFQGLKKIENNDFSQELEKSFTQVKQIQDGVLPKQSIKSFLDEL